MGQRMPGPDQQGGGGGGDIGQLIDGVGSGLEVLGRLAGQSNPEAGKVFGQCLQLFMQGLDMMQGPQQQVTPAEGAAVPNPQMRG